MKVCKKYASECGYKAKKVFQGTGKSARFDDDPAFLEMIEYCISCANGIEVTVLYNTSRLARNRKDAIICKRMLNRKRIQVEYVSQNMNHNDERGFLVEGLMELFDDHCSRLLAEYHKEDDRAGKELFRAVRTETGASDAESLSKNKDRD